MNLLPSTEKEHLKKGLKYRSLIAASWLAAAFFFIGLILLLPSYFLTMGNFSKTDKESYSLSAKNDDSTKEILNMPNEINGKLKLLKANFSSVSVAESISRVVELMPQEVKVDTIAFSRTKNKDEKTGPVLSISGNASSRDSLISFNNLLKESGLFSSVDMPVSSLTKDKNLPFSMNLFLKSQK